MFQLYNSAHNTIKNHAKLRRFYYKKYGRHDIHCVSKKNKTANSCPLLPQMLTDFQNSFTGRLTGKFETNSCLNIHHTLNVSLHYLVKYLCSKNRNAQGVIEANCHVRLRPLKKSF